MGVGAAEVEVEAVVGEGDAVGVVDVVGVVDAVEDNR